MELLWEVGAFAFRFFVKLIKHKFSKSDVNALWYLNATDADLFNQQRPHLNPSLSPEQKQIVAVARRKLSLPAQTAGGKLARLSTYATCAIQGTEAHNAFGSITELKI